jgi:hypothetical protein
MAAASNKPGAVHYALIIFVMITVILGIVTYQYNRSFSDASAELATKADELGKQKAVVSSLIDQVQVLKKLTGRSFDVIDNVNDPKDMNTVKSAAIKDMNEFGRELVGKDYAETLQKLREALDAALADRDSKIAQVASLDKDLKTERDRLNLRIDTAGKAQSKAETDKQQVVATQDERVNALRDEISKLNQDKNALDAQLLQEKEARDRERLAKNAEIAKLDVIINRLREELDQIQNVSFEVPDGLIVRVDLASKLVWINLGEDDFLKPRMTFSVYAKDNLGVGRGIEDIKGKIEVTKILSRHMAEAKITDEELTRPMVSNDLIYTPLWSPGLVEKFAFVGVIDLDGDGKSDWDELKQLLAVSGASIDTYVDDEGKRLPAESKITFQTKWLVRGEIPERDSVSTDSDKARLLEIYKHNTDMTNEGRVNGVRTVRLNDFLAYIGFEAKRRIFRPNQDRPFNLKAGGGSSASAAESGDRSSSGSVSGIFGTKRKSAPQLTSDGHTSKLFTPAAKP